MDQDQDKQDLSYKPEDVSDHDHRYAREPGKQSSHSGQMRDPHLPGEYAEAQHVHVPPMWLLVLVLVILVVLTLVNTVVTTVNLGPYNIWAALGIAVIEAVLVAFYYMHLRWDSSFNRLVLVTALILVSVFIGIALLDTSEYKQNFKAPVTHLKVTSSTIGQSAAQ